MAPPMFMHHAMMSAIAVLAVVLAVIPFSDSTPAFAEQAPRPRFGIRKTETPHLTITTSTSRPAAGTGTRVSLFVDVSPKPRMHVYAPVQKEYIPVSLSLEPGEAFKPHPPVFPKAEKYFFEPLRETQLVYSRRFRILQDVTLVSTPASRRLAQDPDAAVRIKGTLRYQACDDKVCYMPQTLAVEWTIGLKPSEQ